MRALSCASARRQLERLHDGELPVEGQIAISAHLESCDDCADALEDLRFTREVLRGSAPGRAALSDDETVSLQSSVVSRLKAEDAISLRATLREMFEDMHFVYAGLGAAAAVCLCAVITLGMLRSATRGQSASFVGYVATAMGRLISQGLNVAGSDDNPMSFGAAISLPRPTQMLDIAAPSPDGEGDAVVTFVAIVTRDGRVKNLERLPDHHEPEADVDEARLAESVVDAAARARFEPASQAGLPVAANMVWVVAHTTVRGSKEGEVPARPVNARKRSASLELEPRLPSTRVSA